MNPAIAARLGRLLPRLGSNYDGEVVATARGIGNVLQGAGCDWHDLVQALLPSPPLPDAAGVSNNKSNVWWCFHRRYLLSPHDRKFIEDLTKWHKPLSHRQQKWLQDIYEKLERGVSP